MAGAQVMRPRWFEGTHRLIAVLRRQRTMLVLRYLSGVRSQPTFIRHFFMKRLRTLSFACGVA